jgi:aryl-alcohol dehydrogenase-like predicted oxidoreductase
MRYKLLGYSGLRVSELCLGTMTFGTQWGIGADKDESSDMYDAFRDAGGNFIDTANMYTAGSSERYLSDFLSADRDEVVLATKYTLFERKGDPNGGGNHRKNMMHTVERSLKRLKTDFNDLLWLHDWDFMTPAEEGMRGLDDLVRMGKVLYIGISDTPAWVVARCNTIAELRGWTRFVGLQVEYSLVQREAERDLLPMAKSLDIGVTAWSPLASGILTGKYAAAKSDDAERRLDSISFHDVNARNLKIAAVVVETAEELGCSPAQLALAWLRTKKVIPILGARTTAQLQDNLGCLDIDLDAEVLAKLEEAAPVDLGFPHAFLRSEMVRDFIYSYTRDSIDPHRLSDLNE